MLIVVVLVFTGLLIWAQIAMVSNHHYIAQTELVKEVNDGIKVFVDGDKVGVEAISGDGMFTLERDGAQPLQSEREDTYTWGPKRYVLAGELTRGWWKVSDGRVGTTYVYLKITSSQPTDITVTNLSYLSRVGLTVTMWVVWALSSVWFIGGLWLKGSGHTRWKYWREARAARHSSSSK